MSDNKSNDTYIFFKCHNDEFHKETDIIANVETVPDG